jgi:SHS2 domain-containing protein
VRVEGADLENTLVQFLDDCLYRYEARGELVVGATLKHVSPSRAEGEVFIVDDPQADGPAITGVSYHDLVVTRAAGGWVVRVYLDR